MPKSNVSLPAEVAQKYDLVGWTGSARQFFGPKLGHVDVSKLTITQADRLVKMGFRYLKPKPKAEKKEAAKPEK